MRFRGSIARSPECALKRSIAILAILPAAVLLDAHAASARQVEEPHWYDNAPRFPGPPRAEEGSDAVPRRARITRRHGSSRRAARGVPATRGVKRPADRRRMGMRRGADIPWLLLCHLRVPRVTPAHVLDAPSRHNHRPRWTSAACWRHTLSCSIRPARCKPLSRPPSSPSGCPGQPRAAGARSPVRSHWRSQVSAPVPGPPSRRWWKAPGPTAGPLAHHNPSRSLRGCGWRAWVRPRGRRVRPNASLFRLPAARSDGLPRPDASRVRSGTFWRKWPRISARSP